jgi:hypothetical protein
VIQVSGNIYLQFSFLIMIERCCWSYDCQINAEANTCNFLFTKILNLTTIRTETI